MYRITLPSGTTISSNSDGTINITCGEAIKISFVEESTYAEKVVKNAEKNFQEVLEKVKNAPIYDSRGNLELVPHDRDFAWKIPREHFLDNMAVALCHYLFVDQGEPQRTEQAAEERFNRNVKFRIDFVQQEVDALKNIMKDAGIKRMSRIEKIKDELKNVEADLYQVLKAEYVKEIKNILKEKTNGMFTPKGAKSRLILSMKKVLDGSTNLSHKNRLHIIALLLDHFGIDDYDDAAHGRIEKTLYRKETQKEKENIESALWNSRE